MIATTILTWTLLIASIAGDGGQIQALTTVPGFGSEEACVLAQKIAEDSLPADIKVPLMICLPVDGAKPLPDMLKNLLQPE